MNSTLNNLVNSTTNWLFPNRCIRCNTEIQHNGYPCCDNCYIELPFHPNSCTQCGRAFAANQLECGPCIAKPPPFDLVFCPFQFESPISDKIRDFKYHNRPELARILARLLAREIQAHNIELPDALIPAPLHIRRLKERGYNQSTLLAKALAKRLRIPVKHNAIKKVKKTAAQAQLSLKERESNLKGAFELSSPIKSKSIAIIDDVVTTGSTAAEISKILKRNGVNYVQVWGISHTV